MDLGKILGSGEPPILGEAARRRVAQELRTEAELPPFADPRFIALRLGRRLAVRSPALRERTTASVILYSWHPDERERGGRVHVALAESYLIGRGLAHTPPDVGLLALDVALPPEERGAGLAYLIWNQRYLPTAAIRAVLQGLRVSA